MIRYVDRLSTATPVRYLGLPDAAFTEDAFLVLRKAGLPLPGQRI